MVEPTEFFVIVCGDSLNIPGRFWRVTMGRGGGEWGNHPTMFRTQSSVTNEFWRMIRDEPHHEGNLRIVTLTVSDAQKEKSV